MTPQLDPEQTAAVLAPRGPVCVLAGAGTGKTRTITHRIAHLVADGHVAAGQVLAVTFTSRAAAEMRARLRGLGIGGADGAPGVQAVTFHAAAMRQLRYFWPRAIGDTRWQLLDNKFPVVGRAARDCGLRPETDTIRDLLSEIDWAKASEVTPELYASAVEKIDRTAPLKPETVAEVYEAYERRKTDSEGNRLLDFDDLILMTAAILDDNPVVAEEFRDRYRSFVVDEYQDVTPLQQRLLNAWLGQRDDLTVVGDANQTIYSFTGATPRYLLDFTRRFEDATIVRLRRDYRSTPQVVELANKVIGAATGRVAGTRLELIGQRPEGPRPTYVESDDEPAEAKQVAERIGELLAQGVPASEIAILYRINAQSAVHENALTEAGIPYQVRGGDSFFERPEIGQAIRELSTRANDFGGVADADLVRLVGGALERLGLSEKAPDGARARDRWESLRALVELTRDLVAERPGLNLLGLLTELRTRAEAKHPPTMQGVTLSSLHAAKGLEWDAVFLVGLTEGSVPISQAIAKGEQEPIEEERRLLYVGVTRARVHLQLSWALARNEGGRRIRKRSRFLDVVAAEAGAAGSPPAPTRGKRRGSDICRVCGKVLDTREERLMSRCDDCPSELNDGLVVALKQWRTGQASEQKIPPYTIFSNATLFAIAEHQPRSRAALVRINGIGATKAERYGDEVLALVAEHA
ncbi:ATP-dependent DNA helicase UvrD2 [Tsukamurella sp. 8F]|uniref:ATP-dependent DNA helicase UvrD2 n=1 Tax=unclassified Tsukamurella TaxID=2633480 RepID=UPI0023B930FB|nr:MULTISPECIES: ATP-dependent DNA helicase UvrD2 [unclassified Tsukamurella]MDF0528888.1 ATP-dependent DNA helicase UvrD2 [Tsukamurella sp. 8J]MDF0586723.1 ATP-dependent DNA helicase UvrD2 [Tsukamurella sp. 8F]